MLLKTQEGTSCFVQNELKTNRFLTAKDPILHEKGEQTTHFSQPSSFAKGLHRGGKQRQDVRPVERKPQPGIRESAEVGKQVQVRPCVFRTFLPNPHPAVRSFAKQ
jgi:hypothetical protein